MMEPKPIVQEGAEHGSYRSVTGLAGTPKQTRPHSDTRRINHDHGRLLRHDTHSEPMTRHRILQPCRYKLHFLFDSSLDVVPGGHCTFYKTVPRPLLNLNLSLNLQYSYPCPAHRHSLAPCAPSLHSSPHHPGRPRFHRVRLHSEHRQLRLCLHKPSAQPMHIPSVFAEPELVVVCPPMPSSEIFCP